MKTSEKIRVAVSIIAAAGVFGVCAAVYGSDALPLWARITAEALAVVNLVCTIMSMQDLVKRSKK